MTAPLPPGRGDLDTLNWILISWAVTFILGAVGAALGSGIPFVVLCAMSIVYTALVIIMRWPQ